MKNIFKIVFLLFVLMTAISGRSQITVFPDNGTGGGGSGVSSASVSNYFAYMAGGSINFALTNNPFGSTNIFIDTYSLSLSSNMTFDAGLGYITNITAGYYRIKYGVSTLYEGTNSTATIQIHTNGIVAGGSTVAFGNGIGFIDAYSRNYRNSEWEYDVYLPANTAINLRFSSSGRTGTNTISYDYLSAELLNGGSFTSHTTNVITVIPGAAGSDTQVQYNNSGAMAGSQEFTWDDASHTLSLAPVANDATLILFGLANFYGDLNAQNLKPLIHDTYDIGTFALAWRTGYYRALRVSGDQTNAGNLRVSGNLTVAGDAFNANSLGTAVGSAGTPALFQYFGNGAAAGKVLTSTDGLGTAAWQPAGGGGDITNMVTPLQSMGPGNTNVWFDCNVGTNFVWVPLYIGRTNWFVTNGVPGKHITIFTTNAPGQSANLSQFGAGNYTDGVVVDIASNCWSMVDIMFPTNGVPLVVVHTAGLALIGNWTTNYSNRTISLNSDVSTNAGSGTTITADFNGPGDIFWYPTANGTCNITNIPVDGLEPGTKTNFNKILTIAVPTNGWSTLTFVPISPQTITWIDGGPYFNSSATNYFIIKKMATNMWAWSLQSPMSGTGKFLGSLSPFGTNVTFGSDATNRTNVTIVQNIGQAVPMLMVQGSNGVPLMYIESHGHLELTNSIGTTLPDRAPTNYIGFSGASMAGNMLPLYYDDNGGNYPMSKARWKQRPIEWRPLTGNKIASIGGSVQSNASITISTIAGTEEFPMNTQFITGAGVSNSAAIFNENISVHAGTKAGFNGFFAVFEWGETNGVTANVTNLDHSEFIGFTDIAAGNTVTNMTVATNANNVAQNYLGFSYAGRLGTNWHVICNDGQSTNDTHVNLTTFPHFGTNMYRGIFWCPPRGRTIGWRIENLLSGTSTQNFFTTTIPTNAMRVAASITTFTNIAHSMRVSHVFVEAPINP